jgi:hypothetical protein
MQRFWDGHQWTEHTAPFIPPPTSAETIDTTVSVPVLAGAIAMVLVVIGMVCNFQSVSLAQGSGIIWIGAAHRRGRARHVYAARPNIDQGHCRDSRFDRDRERDLRGQAARPQA